MKRLLGPVLMFLTVFILVLTMVVLVIYKTGYHPQQEQSLDVDVGTWASLVTAERSSRLRVLYLNFNHGLGTESIWYERAEPVKEQHDLAAIKGRIDKLAELIMEKEIDVVVLQEVDFQSDATGRVDQAQLLAKRIGFPYLARAKAQELDVTLYPDFFNLELAGRIDTGAVVISYLPIVRNVQFPLPPSRERSWDFESFGPMGFTQEVRLQARNGGEVKIIQVFLDEWSRKARESQASTAAEWISVRDFNDTLVLGSVFAQPLRRPHNPEEAARFGPGDYTLDLLRHKRSLVDLILDWRFLADPQPYLNTLDPATGDLAWLYDYALVGPGVREPRLETLQAERGLSDHVPLILEIEVPSPTVVADSAR